MSTLSTHVLDTAAGKPAEGVAIRLERQDQHGDFKPIATATTNADGRAPNLLADDHPLMPGVYRLRFEIDNYFKKQGVDCFYPYAQVVFRIDKRGDHFHVPLLVAPYGYSTYRGS